MGLNFHEDLGRSHDVRRSSNRKFGMLVGACFLVLGLWRLRTGGEVRLWALALGGLLLLLGLAAPSVLDPLNRLWFQLGLLMGRIVNPIVMGLLFFVVITPVAYLMHWSGKDPLRLKPDQETDSFWIPRVPPGPQPESMSKQF